MIVNEIRCKSILNKSGIPGIDYALNPYTGCEHGCRYCYAIFMKRFSNHKEEWGSFVDVKINAPNVLREQLKKAKPGKVSLSTVTDPYQPLEKKYEITRKCLKELVQCDFPVSILTKSKLVVRDIDLFRKLKEIDVGFSIGLSDERIKMIFEPKSASIKKRFNALHYLAREGIKTWIFFSPVLPYLSDTEEHINQLFEKAENACVDYVLVDTLQLYPKVWNKVQRILQRFYPDFIPLYKQYLFHKDSYKNEMKGKVLKIAQNHNLPCKFTY
ncbi:radical SAM protein [candidate division WOR-3 bacterium]|nr:radical SAM protein [candidate division WOR-3 bacterium]